MSRDYREKGRAVFLAALMVLSVVTMTTAFAGSVAAVTNTENTSFPGSGESVDEASTHVYSEVNTTLIDLNDANSGQTVNVKVYFNNTSEGRPVITSTSGVTSNISSSNQAITEGNLTFTLQPSSSNKSANVSISDLEVQYPSVNQNVDTELKMEVNDTGGTDQTFDLGTVTVTDQDNRVADGPVKNLDTGAEYQNISDALAGAGLDSGDTIQVDPGTYNESFSINTANVTLESTGSADETTIDTGSSRINIGANNVTIDGFSFVFESQAIYETGNENVTIRNNDFELAEGAESNGYAIRFEGPSSDGEARNNEFVGIYNATPGEYGNGIIVSGPDGHEIVGNTFINNSIGVNVGGQQPAGALKVANNNFTQQDDWAIALNHDASGTPEFNITGNQIESNAVGVLVLAGGSIHINKNNIVDNGVDASALSGDTVNATKNWWGNTSGPSGAGPGNGSAVSENVSFSPWLTAPFDENPEFGEQATIQNNEVSFTETATQNITFAQDVNGSVTVSESRTPPASAPTQGTTSILTLVVNVPADAEDSPATLTMFFSEERLNALGLEISDLEDRITILHERNGEFEAISSSEITVTEQNGGAEVVFEVDGFSSFVIGVADPPESRLGVAITGTNAPITAGEDLQIDVRAVSIGGFSGTQSIELNVSSLGNSSTTVTVSEDGRTSKTLVLETDPGDAGTYTATVQSEDSTATTTVTVMETDTPTVADYTNAEGIVETGGLVDAIEDWRADTITTELLIDVIDAWRSGEPVTSPSG